MLRVPGWEVFQFQKPKQMETNISAQGLYVLELAVGDQPNLLKVFGNFGTKTSRIQQAPCNIRVNDQTAVRVRIACGIGSKPQ